MFIESTQNQVAPIVEVQVEKPAAAPKRKSKPKPKERTFGDVRELMMEWQPQDPNATRRLLTSEVMTLLDEKGYSFIKACIPSVIVEGQFPIDIMHYRCEQDAYEFLTRMMWMHQEYGSAIGILLGVSDDETANKIDEACGTLLREEKDCCVILM